MSPRAPAPRRLPLRIPRELPIWAKRREIAEAIRAHQVVVVCGETGSGKTTQLPKLCLAAGRGRRGRIGHTQPRRIAARAVAERIAEELGSPLGRDVGYKVRFTDRTSPGAAIKLMTDGILLAESQRDRELREYDTLILDEAHERSLNIDFLLGYLRRLLERRRDLHLVITSATIHPESFAAHFGDAPIVEVSGRTYPVEVRYRPLAEESDEQGALERGLLDALAELFAEGPGDALVFLSGEREIRETAAAVAGRFGRDVEVLPLFGRLAARDQHRIFARGDRRRVVLATNIAETSLTVPGIRFVVDSGLARISRFQPRTKVQRLPIEKISQASAQQRAGRCGRIEAGVCIRLYSEEDFEERERYTPPEILRTNLASVILRMKVMGLGAIEEFPFLDPPETRAAREGVRLLQELEALDGDGEPTPIGRRMSRLPVDPRIARIVLAAHREGCLAEGLVVAAALSIQDPRERPADRPEQADAAHAAFADPRSDFVSYLRLWDALPARPSGSKSRLRKWCRQHFLSYSRVYEWTDVHRQLLALCREIRGLGRPAASIPSPDSLDDAAYERLHRALLAGFATLAAQREESGHAYRSVTGRSVYLFPGSSLFARKPRWIVAAEHVETTRLYARTCARVAPEWIEQVAAHLVSRAWESPAWSERHGRVEASLRVTLGGLVLEPGRRVPFGDVDPELAHEIFLREGLVADRLHVRAPFAQRNRELLAEIDALEQRARRRGLFAGDEALYRFYAGVVPGEVRDRTGFERWRKRAETHAPDLLLLQREDVLRDLAHGVTDYDFPPVWRDEHGDLTLEYRFEPGHPADGITVVVPAATLGLLRPEPFEWLVPGLLHEKVVALLRTLPKSLRRDLLPLADVAADFLDQRAPRRPSLEAALRDFVSHRLGRPLPGSFDRERLPVHLSFRFRIVDTSGAPVAEGRDLAALQAELADTARASLAEAAEESPWRRRGVTRWDFGDLPEVWRTRHAGLELIAYPTVVARPDHVDLELREALETAERVSRLGVARLLLLTLPEQAKVVGKAVSHGLALHWRTLPPCPFPAPFADAFEGLADQLALAAAHHLVTSLPHDAAAFARLAESSRGTLWRTASDLAGQADRILEQAAKVRAALGHLRDAIIRADLETQIHWLLFRSFLVATPAPGLARLPHYLRGMELRIDKARHDPARDRRRLAELAPALTRFQAALSGLPPEDAAAPAWVEHRFALEELRLSLFAQEVRTAGPISRKRIDQAWQRLVGAA